MAVINRVRGLHDLRRYCVLCFAKTGAMINRRRDHVFVIGDGARYS